MFSGKSIFVNKNIQRGFVYTFCLHHLRYHENRRLLDDDDQIPGDIIKPGERQRKRNKSGKSGRRGDNKKNSNGNRFFDFFRISIITGFSIGRRSANIRNKTGSGINIGAERKPDAFRRGGIKIRTQRKISDGSALSTVTIRNLSPDHSGKYECRPANLEPSFVNLHVIKGNYFLLAE